MGTYDVVMLTVVAACTIWGLWRGVAWQLAAIASIVVSYLVALRFSPQLAPLLSEEEPWNRFAAMLVLYLATSLAVWVVFRWFSSALERIKLKEFDHQIGGLFGLAQGVLLCTAITFFVVTLSEKGRETVVKSKSGHYIAQLLDMSNPLIPESVHEVLHPYMEQLHDELHGDHELGAPEGTRSAQEERDKHSEKEEAASTKDNGPLDRVLAQMELIRKARSGQRLSPEETRRLQEVIRDLKTLARQAHQDDDSPAEEEPEESSSDGVVEQLLEVLGSQTLFPLHGDDDPDRSAGSRSPGRSRR